MLAHQASEDGYRFAQPLLAPAHGLVLGGVCHALRGPCLGVYPADVTTRGLAPNRSVSHHYAVYRQLGPPLAPVERP